MQPMMSGRFVLFLFPQHHLSKVPSMYVDVLDKFFYAVCDVLSVRLFNKVPHSAVKLAKLGTRV
jgi:hypothetical protein